MAEKKQSFNNLLVWQKSVELSKEIYLVTRSFPKEEVFGITNQLRRCSVSIASNIAEGAARYSKPEFKYFLSIAIGSSAELKTQLLIAKEVDILSIPNYENLMTKIEEVSKMLISLRKKLN